MPSYLLLSRLFSVTLITGLAALDFGGASDIPSTTRTVQSEGATVSPQKNAPIHYHITDLETLGGNAHASAINNKSQIVGQSAKPGSEGIFLWQDGKMRDLGTLHGKSETSAASINSKGYIVGSASNGGDALADPPNAILWREGKMERLFPDARYSEAGAINDKNQIVGETLPSGQIRHAFLWQDGKITELGSLHGGDTLALDINASGQVVGDSAFNAESLHGFLWENAKMRDLGTLGGSQSEANGINDSTQIVGVSDTANAQSHAFLWEKGKMFDLGSPGAGVCYVKKINNKGVIIGFWWPDATGYKGSRALVWIDRKMYDLNDLIPANSGWVLDAAIGINDKGEIVGSGKHNGAERGFLLTPVIQKKAGSNGAGKP